MSYFGSVPTTLAVKRAPILQAHRDLIGAIDDMVVGEDVAIARK
jgi:hypothetical protein